MPREQEPPASQLEFILSALEDHIRIDGRELLQSREPVLEFGDELGWVECRFGKTRVVAQVSATIVKPRSDRPYEGLLSIHSEISSMASSVYEVGRPSEEEVTITRMMEKVLRRSEAVDRESLCILAGQRVWSIKLTLHFLSDSGNMLDCACLAGIAALRHFRKPDVEVVGDEVIVHSPGERAPMPLSIRYTPICVTLAFFVDSKRPILDPSHLESLLEGSHLSIALSNAQSVSPTLCVLHKAGGIPLTNEEVMNCVRIAQERAKELSEFVDVMLERDWKTRRRFVELV